MLCTDMQPSTANSPEMHPTGSGWFGLEWILKTIQFQPPDMDRDTFYYSRLLQAVQSGRELMNC